MLWFMKHVLRLEYDRCEHQWNISQDEENKETELGEISLKTMTVNRHLSSELLSCSEVVPMLLQGQLTDDLADQLLRLVELP